MENSLFNAELPNFGKNLSFIMDHDSGYMSAESTTRQEEEKFISEVIPNAGNNTEDAVDGKSDLKNWKVVATSFMNIVQPNQVNSKISLTPQKKFENPINPNVSPDLFGDEDVESVSNVESTPLTHSVVEKKYIIKKDVSLVKRVTNSLKGVIPPNCMTVVHLSVDEILNKIETNKDYFWNCDKVLPSENIQVLNTSNESSEDDFKSLLLTGNKDIVDKKFPDIMEWRFHGLQ